MALVTGRVVGRDGQAVAGAAIYVVAAPVALPDIAQLTGPDGSFDVFAPVPGSYTIGASGAGGKGEATVAVLGGDPEPVEIVLGG